MSNRGLRIACFCLGASVLCTAACSALVSFDGYVGVDGGSPADSGVDASIVDATQSPSDAPTQSDATTQIDASADAASPPPAFRATSYTTNGGAGSSVSVTKPAGTQPGDLLVAMVYMYNYGTQTTPPADAVAWQKFLTIEDPGPSYEVYWYAKIAGTSEPLDYTFAVTTNGFASLSITAYSGANSDLNAAINVTGSILFSGGSEVTTAFVAPTLNTTVPNTLLVIGCVADGQQGATWIANNVTGRQLTGPTMLGDLADSKSGTSIRESATCSVAAQGGAGVFAIAPP